MLQGFCFSELSFSLNDFSSLVTGKKNNNSIIFGLIKKKKVGFKC